MKIRKEIKDIDKILSEVSKKISFSILNSINEPKVRTDFLKNKKINPILKYPEPNKELLNLRRKVSSINIDEKDVLDSIMIEKQADIIRKIDLINSVGCFDFTEKSKKLYGLPSKSLVDYAYSLFSEKIKLKKTKKVPAKEAIRIIKENLKRFDLNYSIQRGDVVTSCLVNLDSKTIILKKKARFSNNFINRLIVHEIGTHVFRAENGKKQKLKVFKSGLANYLETEEGLAVYNEERFGLLKKVFLQNYAGRVIAVNYAQKKTFCETFKELKRFFDDKHAFQLTLRAKRGISDTSLPGGLTKDFLYLNGYQKIKKFVKNGNKIEDLYLGKIGIKNVNSLKKLNLKKAKILPKSFILLDKII